MSITWLFCKIILPTFPFRDLFLFKRGVSALEMLVWLVLVSFSSQGSGKGDRSMSTSVSWKQPSKAIACTASMLYIPEACQQSRVTLCLAGTIVANHKWIKHKRKKAFPSVLFSLWRGYHTVWLSVGPDMSKEMSSNVIKHTRLPDYCQLLAGNSCLSFWNRRIKFCPVGLCCWSCGKLLQMFLGVGFWWDYPIMWATYASFLCSSPHGIPANEFTEGIFFKQRS